MLLYFFLCHCIICIKYKNFIPIFDLNNRFNLLTRICLVCYFCYVVICKYFLFYYKFNCVTFKSCILICFFNRCFYIICSRICRNNVVIFPSAAVEYVYLGVPYFASAVGVFAVSPYVQPVIVSG